MPKVTSRGRFIMPNVTFRGRFIIPKSLPRGRFIMQKVTSKREVYHQKITSRTEVYHQKVTSRTEVYHQKVTPKEGGLLGEKLTSGPRGRFIMQKGNFRTKEEGIAMSSLDPTTLVIRTPDLVFVKCTLQNFHPSQANLARYSSDGVSYHGGSGFPPWPG